MEPRDVKRVVVIGAGIMGHSIAQVFSQYGIEARLVDSKREQLDRAGRLIKLNLNTLAGHGRISPSDIPAILDRIRFATDPADACKGVDMAVEAVSEVPAVKKSVFDLLDKHCPPEAVIASNTSSLDVFSIAEIKKPERLVTTHWFMPPHIIPLVEIAPGPLTSPETISLAVGLMKRLGKQPIVMKKFVPGYIVNRMQQAIFMVIMDLLAKDAASKEDIDLAVKTSLGIRLPVVGVVQNLDFNGLNLVYDMLKAGGLNPPPFIAEAVDKGHFGASTSKGLYDYGGRSEEELLKKRDELYLKMLDHLEAIKAFKPI